MRPADTIKIVKKGALHVGDRGAITDVREDGRVTARFRGGKFTVDVGEFVVIDRRVGDTIEIVKGGALPVGERGVIEDLQDDGDVQARFEQGTRTVKGGEYAVVS